MKTTWKLAAIGGAAAAMLAGCSHTVTEREVVREQPIVQQRPATTVEHVTVIQPPPAPQEPMPPAPSTTGYSWVPGHYVWRDGNWSWDAGQWRLGTIPPMPQRMDE